MRTTVRYIPLEYQKKIYDFTVDDFKLEGYEYTKLEDKIEVAI